MRPLMPPCSLISSTNGRRMVSGGLPLDCTPNWAKVSDLKTRKPMVMVLAVRPRSGSVLASIARSGATTPPLALEGLDGAENPLAPLAAALDVLVTLGPAVSCTEQPAA